VSHTVYGIRFIEIGFGDLMDDLQFQELLQYLGLSWRGYRKVRKGVKKRIRRHMHLLGCHDVSEYLAELEKDDDVKKQCELMMTVSISRFFRDQMLWQVLENEILPGLIQVYKEKLLVWSAGCACGEEVYSLKILWDQFMPSVVHKPELAITATDMNPEYLERAKKGIYSSSSLKELPMLLLPLYFQADSSRKRYTINASQKKGIEWQERDFGSDPPEFQFHMIFLRNNLLTYYQNGFKRMAFEKVVDCLSDGGFLIIGSHEHLPFEEPSLLPHKSLSYIFKKGREQGVPHGVD